MTAEESQSKLWQAWLREHGLVGIVLFAYACFAFWLKNDIAGILLDDGVYLIGAKALAMGQGYTLISDPHMPGIILYPPLFSLLLAPFWWLGQDPVTVVGLAKSFNIGIGLVGLAAIYGLARWQYGLGKMTGVLIVALVAANYYWLVYSTHIMTEPLYLVLSLVVAGYSLWLHKTPQKQLPFSSLLGLALLCAALFYTRTFGMAFIVACVIWLWLRFNRRNALVFILLSLVFCAPWSLWVQAQPSTVYAISNYWVVPYNQTYFTHYMVAQITAESPWALLWQGLVGMQQVFFDTLIPVSSQPLFVANPLVLELLRWLVLALVVLGVLLCFRRYANEAGLFQQQTTFATLVARLRSYGVSPVAVYVAFYLAAMPLWFATNQYSRFLLMVLPLLAMMIAKAALPWFQEAGRRVRWAVTSLLLAVLLSQGVVYYKLFPLSQNHMLTDRSLPLWQEYQQAIAYIEKNVPRDAVIWNWQSMLFPVYTPHQFICYNLFPDAQTFKSGAHKNDPTFVPRVVVPLFHGQRVQYLLTVPSFSRGQLLNPVDPHSDLFQQALPHTLEELFVSPSGYVRLYRWHDPLAEGEPAR